jgi:hypothetical protein
MADPTKELAFQNDVSAQMQAAGWKLGDPARDDRACALYPGSPEQKLLERVAEQLAKADPNAANNTDEQAMLGDFPKAVDDAILDSSAAHENQKLQLLADPKKAAAFAKLVFDLLKIAG